MNYEFFNIVSLFVTQCLGLFERFGLHVVELVLKLRNLPLKPLLDQVPGRKDAPHLLYHVVDHLLLTVHRRHLDWLLLLLLMMMIYRLRFLLLRVIPRRPLHGNLLHVAVGVLTVLSDTSKRRTHLFIEA